MKMKTVTSLFEAKSQQRKIVMMTCYDASMAKIASAADVDCLLVGDSLGQVIQGHPTTVPVKVSDIAYHTDCVNRGNTSALIVGDMPFMSYATVEIALETARILMQRGAHMVKLEGGAERIPMIRAITENGIPVCGHIGLTPQSVNLLGGYRVQGKTAVQADLILQDAKALEAAGMQLLVLECVPQQLAAAITESLKIPTIGIGAGPYCDGQVLVVTDLLGISPHIPRFARNFLHSTNSISAAVAAYVEAVRSGTFPSAEYILA